MNKESALLEIGKFHLSTRDLEPEFVTPKFRLKIHAGNLQFPLLWPPNDEIVKSLHQILASPQIPRPKTSSKHTIRLMVILSTLVVV